MYRSQGCCIYFFSISAILKSSKKRNISDQEERLISTPADYIETTHVEYYLQPMVLATILSPKLYEHAILRLCDVSKTKHLFI